MTQSKERREQIKSWKQMAGVASKDSKRIDFEAYDLNQAELAKLHNTDLTTDYALVGIYQTPQGLAVHCGGKPLGMLSKVPARVAEAAKNARQIVGIASIYRTQRDGWVARIEVSNPPTTA